MYIFDIYYIINYEYYIIHIYIYIYRYTVSVLFWYQLLDPYQTHVSWHVTLTFCATLPWPWAESRVPGTGQASSEDHGHHGLSQLENGEATYLWAVTLQAISCQFQLLHAPDISGLEWCCRVNPHMGAMLKVLPWLHFEMLWWLPDQIRGLISSLFQCKLLNNVNHLTINPRPLAEVTEEHSQIKSIVVSINLPMEPPIGCVLAASTLPSVSTRSQLPSKSVHDTIKWVAEKHHQWKVFGPASEKGVEIWIELLFFLPAITVISINPRPAGKELAAVASRPAYFNNRDDPPGCKMCQFVMSYTWQHGKTLVFGIFFWQRIGISQPKRALLSKITSACEKNSVSHPLRGVKNRYFFRRLKKIFYVPSTSEEIRIWPFLNSKHSPKTWRPLHFCSMASLNWIIF